MANSVPRPRPRVRVADAPNTSAYHQLFPEGLTDANSDSHQPSNGEVEIDRQIQISNKVNVSRLWLLLPLFFAIVFTLIGSWRNHMVPITHSNVASPRGPQQSSIRHDQQASTKRWSPPPPPRATNVKQEEISKNPGIGPWRRLRGILKIFRAVSHCIFLLLFFFI